MRSDIVPGGIFPEYELPDHTGKVHKLSELQGGNHGEAHHGGSARAARYRNNSDASRRSQCA